MDSVGYVFDSILLSDDPTFRIVALIAEETCGHLLV
jgi:hypothetical protein